MWGVCGGGDGGIGMVCILCVSCALEEDKGSSPPVPYLGCSKFIDVQMIGCCFLCPVGFAVPPLSLITAPLPVPCSACVRAVFLVLLKERDSATLSRSGSDESTRGITADGGLSGGPWH